MIATKKGVNILERGSQVHFMAEFQEMLDFPPAPKLEHLRQARPAQGDAEPRCAGRSSSSARRTVRAATPALLHRQPDAQPADRAVLQAAR